MASRTAALSLMGLFIFFLLVLVGVQVLKPYRREGFAAMKKAAQLNTNNAPSKNRL